MATRNEDAEVRRKLSLDDAIHFLTIFETHGTCTQYKDWAMLSKATFPLIFQVSSCQLYYQFFKDNCLFSRLKKFLLKKARHKNENDGEMQPHTH
jgi:hypothetical protein